MVGQWEDLWKWGEGEEDEEEVKDEDEDQREKEYGERLEEEAEMKGTEGEKQKEEIETSDVFVQQRRNNIFAYPCTFKNKVFPEKPWLAIYR